MSPPEERVISFAQPPELEDFLALDFPPDKPILGPFSSNQVNMIAGATGIGKTHLAIAIAGAATSGRNLMSWESHGHVPTLLIDGEMAGRQMQTRFAAHRIRDDREPLHIVNAINWCADADLSHPNLADAGWHDIIAQWAPKPGLVILDNVMSLVNVPGVSLNSDEFWRAVMPLNLRLRAMGCCVIWCDHLNSQNLVFGTKTKEWNLDLVFTLTENEITPEYEDKPGTAFTMTFTKVRSERGPEHQTVDVEMQTDDSGAIIWTQKSRKKAEQEKAAELQARGLTQRQIAAELGCSVGKVNKLLRQWRADNTLADVG